MKLFGRTFDFAFSLGEDCACAMYLRRHGLRDMSSPFDWLCNASFETRIRLLCSGFDGFLEKKNLKWYPLPAKGLADRGHDIYKDEVLGFNFYHDFPVGVALDESYDAVMDKYSRRIARLDYRLRNARGRVLAAWWSRDKRIDDGALLRALETMDAEFGPKVCLLACENDMDAARTAFEKVSDRILRIRGRLAPDVGITMGDEKVNDGIFRRIGVRASDDRVGSFMRGLSRLCTMFVPGKERRRALRSRIESRAVATDDWAELNENRESFREAVRGLKDVASDEDRMRSAYSAVMYAIDTGTGYYCSREIEDVFIDVGRRNCTSLSKDFQPGTCLVVMSEAYLFGGHTRVVERWIEADRGRRYSLVLTRKPNGELPRRLLDDVKASGGEVLVLDGDGGYVGQGLELRRIASRYESVVLHVHMNDPVPLVAFGTEDFTRPVGFYNHADHRFWLGAGVSDVVADLRSWGRDVTRRLRGVDDSFLLTIPVDSSPVEVAGRESARAELNVPEGAKVVLTVGTNFKYKPMMGMDFLDLAVPLLKSDPSTYVLGIGMTMDDFPEWRKVSRRYGGRLRALGFVSHDKLYGYYGAADLVLDSRPTSGETAMSDAVRCGCPVLAMANPTGLMEWTLASPAYCGSVPELVEKARRILHDRDYAEKHSRATWELLDRCSGAAAFSGMIDDFFRLLLSKRHRVRDFSPRSLAFSDLDRYHLNVNKVREEQFRIGKLVDVYKERDINGKRKIVEVCGVKALLRRSRYNPLKLRNSP